MPGLSFSLGVFFLTAATLMLQLVQTRILSVVAWYHLAFFAISLAMFGLAAGAVWVYLRGDRFGAHTLSADLTRYTGAFALATGGSLAVEMTLAPVVARTATSLLVWFELALCLALPFFFAGVAITLALTRSPFRIGLVYGVDLFGAAAGCLGTLALLDATDGPSAVLWVAAIAATGASFFAASGVGGQRPAGGALDALLRRPEWLVFAFSLGALANGLTDHGLRPIAAKGRFLGTEDSIFEAWNSFSRVAVSPTVRKQPQLWGPSPVTPLHRWRIEERRLDIDGDVGTTMIGFSGDGDDLSFLEYDVTNLAYYLPDRQRVAIVGVGGGRDVLSAWSFGARDITGVEINPIFVELLAHTPGHADFANIAQLPGVRLVVDEARSWFARTEERFDLIQMSLTDTWAATGVGAFTLSENALYTREGWRAFLGRLTPRGVFTASRWYAPGDVNETGRLLALAVASLLDLGAPAPSRHLFLASAGKLATLVVSREPLSRADVASLEAASGLLEYEVLVTPSARVGSDVLRAIAGAPTLADLEHVTAGFALDLSPPSDDRPFFFNQLRLRDLGGVARVAAPLLGRSAHRGGVMRGNLVATATLAVLFGVASALVLCTIVIPLHSAVRDAGWRLAVGGTGYFALIGVGFMVVEIALLQRVSVFLGHPIYALSVVLFTLIAATGAGSLVSEALRLETRARFCAWAASTAAYLAGLTVWLPGTLLAFEGAEILARAGLCVAALAPAGLLLGMAFPTGMRLAAAVDPRPTPWFWGINGACGTLAAIGAVATSLAFGISATLRLGALCYLLLIPAAAAIGWRGKQTARRALS